MSAQNDLNRLVNTVHQLAELIDGMPRGPQLIHALAQARELADEISCTYCLTGELEE
jgi:hypothetical protein